MKVDHPWFTTGKKDTLSKKETNKTKQTRNPEEVSLLEEDGKREGQDSKLLIFIISLSALFLKLNFKCIILKSHEQKTKTLQI